jgi:hypothetical protein
VKYIPSQHELQFPSWTEKKHVKMTQDEKLMKKGLTDSYPLVIMCLNFKINSH